MLLAVLTVIATLGQSPAPAAAVTGGAGEVEQEPALSDTPFDRQGMWVWYVERSHGGSVPAIVSQAKRAGIGTVYIKAGDGDDVWGQFSRGLVRALHRGGLSVCAWQFVYGDRPVAEARVAAAAVAKGADCFAIDAEGDYEGKYASADLYIRTLRAKIGAAFPVSLAAFPYVDYHPSFPYSVFLGPGGATYNQPQMYWKTIGTSVRAVYEHTYLYNRLCGTPDPPDRADLRKPRQRPAEAVPPLRRQLRRSRAELVELAGDRAAGSGARSARRSAARPVTGYRLEVEHPLLKRGSRGDMVVWAQQRLVGAGEDVPVTGVFGTLTFAAVRSFQADHGLPADGRIGTDTWESLLNFTPYRVRWSGSRARSSGASGSRVQPPSRPLSASLPSSTYEIDPGPAP